MQKISQKSIRYTTWNYTEEGIRLLQPSSRCYIKPILSSTPVDTDDHPGQAYSDEVEVNKRDLANDLCKMICLARYHHQTSPETIKQPHWCFDFFDWLYAYEKYCDQNSLSSDDYKPGERPFRSVYEEWEIITNNLCGDIFGNLFSAHTRSEGLCKTCESTVKKTIATENLSHIQLPEFLKGGERSMENLFSQLQNQTREARCEACNSAINFEEVYDVPSKFVAFRLPINLGKQALRRPNETAFDFEDRLKADNMVLSLKSQKFNDAINLHVRVSINLNQNHYTNSLFSRDNSTIAVECNDSSSKYVKFKDQQLLLRSEFVIYETVRNNKRTLKDAPNSQAKRSKQTSSSTTAITHAQLLASFFDEHAKAYPHSSTLITSQEIQNMITALVSHESSEQVEPFVPITKKFDASCDIELHSFELDNKQDKPRVEFRMRVPQDPTSVYGFVFKRTSLVGEPWDWIASSQIQTGSYKHLASAKTKNVETREAIEKGIVMVFDIALTVLSGCFHFFKDHLPKYPLNKAMFCRPNLHEVEDIDLYFSTENNDTGNFDKEIKKILMSSLARASDTPRTYHNLVLRLLVRPDAAKNKTPKNIKGSLNKSSSSVVKSWSKI